MYFETDYTALPVYSTSPKVTLMELPLGVTVVCGDSSFCRQRAPRQKTSTGCLGWTPEVSKSKPVHRERGCLIRNQSRCVTLVKVSPRRFWLLKIRLVTANVPVAYVPLAMYLWQCTLDNVSFFKCTLLAMCTLRNGPFFIECTLGSAYPIRINPFRS